jgi:hypothetical protein
VSKKSHTLPVGEASRLTLSTRRSKRDSCYCRSKAGRLTYDAVTRKALPVGEASRLTLSTSKVQARFLLLQK